MTQFNPFAAYLEEKPEAAYFSYQNQFGGPQQSSRQRGFFQHQFNNIYNQYLGQLGRQIQAGFPPSDKFTGFLGGFDFNDWYRQQVPYGERNQGFSDFVPNLRWRIPGIGQ